MSHQKPVLFHFITVFNLFSVIDFSNENKICTLLVGFILYKDRTLDNMHYQALAYTTDFAVRLKDCGSRSAASSMQNRPLSLRMA